MSAGKMFCLVVCILISVECSEGGYFQENLPLGIQNTVAIKTDILATQLIPRNIHYAIRDVPEKDAAYSISFANYLYLKRHKVEGQESPYNPDHLELVSANRNDKGSPRHGKPVVPCTVIPLKRSTETNSLNGYNNPLVSATVEPVVQKHVYFHIPPPDFEDPPVIPRVVQSPRKKVNIVFIKAPYYMSDYVYLQNLYRNRQSPIEDKTLIYVLSKKEDSLQPSSQPPKSLSGPDVFFVNYKFNSNDIASVTRKGSLLSFFNNDSPVLEPKKVE